MAHVNLESGEKDDKSNANVSARNKEARMVETVTERAKGSVPL